MKNNISCKGAVKIIVEAAKKYDMKLRDKHFLIVYQEKLAVLPYLHELFYRNCMIGNFINSGIYIKADYFVGDTKAVLSVGFRYGKKADMPVTLYNENVKTLSRPVYKVLAIFAKDYNESVYRTCTYLSKGQELEKLRLPDGVTTIVEVAHQPKS